MCACSQQPPAANECTSQQGLLPDWPDNVLPGLVSQPYGSHREAAVRARLCTALLLVQDATFVSRGTAGRPGAGWVHAMQGDTVSQTASIGRQRSCQDTPAACTDTQKGPRRTVLGRSPSQGRHSTVLCGGSSLALSSSDQAGAWQTDAARALSRGTTCGLPRPRQVSRGTSKAAHSTACRVVTHSHNLIKLQCRAAGRSQTNEVTVAMTQAVIHAGAHQAISVHFIHPQTSSSGGP